MIYLLLTWLAAPLLWVSAISRRAVAPRRILVIQTAKIGDFVATTPVFRALRQKLPEHEIVALLHPVNVPLASGLDSIDRIIELPKQGFKGWAGKRWLWQQLNEGYSGVLILSPNLTNLLVPLWAGVPRRVSVLADRRRGIARLAWPLLTHGEPHRAGVLFRETALRALAGLGVNVDGSVLALPNEAVCTAKGRAHAAAELAGLERPLIGLGLGAGNRMKALDPDQLDALGRRLLADGHGTLVLIGVDADREAAARLMKMLAPGHCHDSTGQWPLADLPALLGALDVFVGVDSGATYLADAVGTPVVDFMGPADAEDQRPLGRYAVAISSTEPCAPCSHAFDAPYRCHLGTRACIAHFPLEHIVSATRKALEPR